jgi:flagellar biosynthesis protein FlhF
LNVKRYIAEDVSGAMEQVRAELGRDALLLNTRKIRRPGLFGFLQKPLVEVVAAYEKTGPPSAAPRRETTPSADPAERLVAVPQGGGDQKLSDLSNKLDSLSLTLGALVGRLQTKDRIQDRLPPEVEPLVLALTENEVHEEFARKLGREVGEIQARQEESEDPREIMEQLLKQYLGEPGPIKLKKYKRTVAILVGPTGVGKTTTLAKLAAIYALNHHARVGVITTDTYRVAAVEQLKTYAEILRVPLTVAYSNEELTDALREYEQCDIVFIDTAGKSPNDPTLESEVLSLVRAADADEVHLVLSATTSFAGCLNIINTYSFLKDFKLLFTKLDETPSWGMLLNLKFLTERTVSYIAAGQTVPDDIEVMNPGKIAKHLLNK